MKARCSQKLWKAWNGMPIPRSIIRHWSNTLWSIIVRNNLICVLMLFWDTKITLLAQKKSLIRLSSRIKSWLNIELFDFGVLYARINNLWLQQIIFIKRKLLKKALELCIIIEHLRSLRKQCKSKQKITMKNKWRERHLTHYSGIVWFTKEGRIDLIRWPIFISKEGSLASGW